MVAAPRHIVVADGGSPDRQSSPGCWPRMARTSEGGVVLAFFDLEQGALLAVTCSAALPHGATSSDGAGSELGCTAPAKIDRLVGIFISRTSYSYMYFARKGEASWVKH